MRGEAVDPAAAWANKTLRGIRLAGRCAARVPGLAREQLTAQGGGLIPIEDAAACADAMHRQGEGKGALPRLNVPIRPRNASHLNIS